MEKMKIVSWELGEYSGMAFIYPIERRIRIEWDDDVPENWEDIEDQIRDKFLGEL